MQCAGPRGFGAQGEQLPSAQDGCLGSGRSCSLRACRASRRFSSPARCATLASENNAQPSCTQHFAHTPSHAQRTAGLISLRICTEGHMTHDRECVADGTDVRDTECPYQQTRVISKTCAGSAGGAQSSANARALQSVPEDGAMRRLLQYALDAASQPGAQCCTSKDMHDAWSHTMGSEGPIYLRYMMYHLLCRLDIDFAKLDSSAWD